MDEKLRKFNVFLFKRYIYMRNSEQLGLYEYFGIWTVPQTFRGITGISPTAYSFPQLTAAIPKHSSTFPTAAFLH
jgi:hypothetical protein